MEARPNEQTLGRSVTLTVRGKNHFYYGNKKGNAAKKEPERESKTSSVGYSDLKRKLEQKERYYDWKFKRNDERSRRGRRGKRWRNLKQGKLKQRIHKFKGSGGSQRVKYRKLDLGNLEALLESKKKCLKAGSENSEVQIPENFLLSVLDPSIQLTIPNKMKTSKST